jgi:DNA-binding MarR family transcriptional regulator
MQYYFDGSVKQSDYLVIKDIEVKMPFTASADDPRAPAVDALRDLMLASVSYRQSVAGYFGVGWTETQAVSYLSAQGGLGQTELAESLGITTSSVTSLIDRLESEGLVKRHRHPDDRRRTTVELTDRGREAVSTTRLWFRAAFDQIDEAELTAVARTLTKLTESLRAVTLTIPAHENGPADHDGERTA